MDDDSLDRKLGGLPPRDLDDLSAGRVRRRAHAVLAEERRLARHALLAPVVRAWSGYVTPTLLGATAAAYLVWAVHAAAALYQ